MSVITALEQELGTELDLVPTLLTLVMEGAPYAYIIFVFKRSLYHIQIIVTGKKSLLLELHGLHTAQTCIIKFNFSECLGNDTEHGTCHHLCCKSVVLEQEHQLPLVICLSNKFRCPKKHEDM